MKKLLPAIAVVASLAARTLLLFGLNAASLEGHMVFEGDKILLPLTIAGDAAYDIEFLGYMAQIKLAMVLGAHKNIYVEPVIWTVE